MLCRLANGAGLAQAGWNFLCPRDQMAFPLLPSHSLPWLFLPSHFVLLSVSCLIHDSSTWLMLMSQSSAPPFETLQGTSGGNGRLVLPALCLTFFNINNGVSRTKLLPTGARAFFLWLICHFLLNKVYVRSLAGSWKLGEVTVHAPHTLPKVHHLGFVFIWKFRLYRLAR